MTSAKGKLREFIPMKNEKNIVLFYKNIAHEMGHNFGMLDDFMPQHGGVGGPCDGKGIMSYEGDLNQWSKCSKKDFEQAYVSKGWGNNCLEDISGMNRFTRQILDLILNFCCSFFVFASQKSLKEDGCIKTTQMEMQKLFH